MPRFLDKIASFGPATNSADAFSHNTYAESDFARTELVASDFLSEDQEPVIGPLIPSYTLINVTRRESNDVR